MFFIDKLMGGLNCSFIANVVHFQPPKANVDDDNCGCDCSPPFCCGGMCGALSNEASVSVAALAKLVRGGQSTAANENKQN